MVSCSERLSKRSGICKVSLLDTSICEQAWFHSDSIRDVKQRDNQVRSRQLSLLGGIEREPAPWALSSLVELDPIDLAGDQEWTQELLPARRSRVLSQAVHRSSLQRPKSVHQVSRQGRFHFLSIGCFKGPDWGNTLGENPRVKGKNAKA